MIVQSAARPTTPRVAHRSRSFAPATVLRYLLLVGVVFFSVFPLLWLLVTSLRNTGELFASPVKIIPQAVTLTQYVKVFTEYNMSDYLMNSVVVSVTTVVLVSVLALPCAYVLARIRLPGIKVIVGFLLIMRMIPVIAFTIPMFNLFSGLNMLDSLTALILAHTASKLPLAIWLLTTFIQDLPEEIEESAQIDGAGAVRRLVWLVAPLVKPGLAASAVLTFLFTWNDLLVALTLSFSTAAQTLPVGLTNFITQFGIDWGPMSAAGVLMVVPTFIFVWFAQNYLVKGLVAGAVK